jgi:hypothetical protein
MAAKHKVTVSQQPADRRQTYAERRAEQIAALATQQADLKREAAERRARRAASAQDPTQPAPRGPRAVGRGRRP